MSQADVDAIVSQLKTFITSEVDRIVHDRLASPWVTASGYGDAAAPGGKISPVGMTYQNYVQHKALLTQIGVAVADDPSIAQITAALGAQVDPMSQAVVAGLKDALPASVGLDYDRVGQIVAVKLDEHVRSFTISTDAPPAAAAGAETEPGQGQG